MLPAGHAGAEPLGTIQSPASFPEPCSAKDAAGAECNAFLVVSGLFETKDPMMQ
jgi:hypothetical protein